MNTTKHTLVGLLAVALLLAAVLPVWAAPGDKYEVKDAGSTEVNGVYT